MGPYSQSQTFANPLGNVFLTAADMTLILGYQPSAFPVTEWYRTAPVEPLPEGVAARYIPGESP
jgi:hypothetical protein